MISIRKDTKMKKLIEDIEVAEDSDLLEDCKGEEHD